MSTTKLLLTFLIALSGTIIHQTNAAPQQQQQTQQLSGKSDASGNIQTSSYPVASQENQLPPAQYYYPTYPDYTKQGIAVQSGYEGYLVPTPPQSPQSSESSGILASLIPLSRTALTYGTRVGTYLLSLLLLLLVGGAFTTSICTFTPLCTITFLGLGLTKSQVKEQVTELARTYITPERVNIATDIVKRAIDKYAALQNQQQKAKKKEMDSSSDQ